MTNISCFIKIENCGLVFAWFQWVLILSITIWKIIRKKKSDCLCVFFSFLFSQCLSFHLDLFFPSILSLFLWIINSLIHSFVDSFIRPLIDAFSKTFSNHLFAMLCMLFNFLFLMGFFFFYEYVLLHRVMLVILGVWVLLSLIFNAKINHTPPEALIRLIITSVASNFFLEWNKI